MKTLLTSILLFFTICGFSQDDKVLIPSPEAASLIKWSKNEVNLSTGAVNTTIPLYTLKDGDLEVPIALHYNGSSGIKVTEAANMVGLGWDLVAGGKIVRVVRDKPDESYTINHIRNEKGGFDGFELGLQGDPTGELVGQSNVSVEWRNEKYNYRGGWYIMGNPFSLEDFQKNDPVLFDSQPDIYIVNIGNDIVKFTFDNTKTPVIINNKDYKIEVDWQSYNPGLFLTKQSWTFNANIGAGEAIVSAMKSVTGLDEEFLPTNLGVTIGINQFFRKFNDDYPKIIGFRGFIITAPNGVKYYFGGSEEFLEYNFNDQAYLNDLDRLTIAVNNLSQRIPYAWALRKIESPFGSNKNQISLKYKRTGFYEPFNASDNKIDTVGFCSFPSPKQDKFTRSFSGGGSYSFKDSAFIDYVNIASLNTLNISYTKPTLEDLAAYVTLNTRVIYGLFPESITSPNFKVTFNNDSLLYANLDSTLIKKLIPNFKAKQFYNINRLDSRAEGSLSSEEELRKGLFNFNKASGQLTYTYGDLTIQSPAIATLGLNHLGKNLDSLSEIFKGDYKKVINKLLPTITYQGNGISAGVNGSGAFVNWSGKIYKVNLQGEFEEVLVPNQKLLNIQITDLNSNKKKGYYFDYGYFDSYYNPNYPNDIITRYNAKTILDVVPDPGIVSDLPKTMYSQLHEKYGLFYTEDKNRLQLKGVYEVVYKSNIVSLQPGIVFKYNNTPLPRRLSMAQDYWGYYNGQHDNRNKSLLVSRPTYSTYNASLSYLSGSDGDPYCPNSSDMRPNLMYAQVGILNEIEFNTGARRSFKYELNSANDYFGKVGGLRVKEIINYDPISNKTYFEKFKYTDNNNTSSGKLAIIPDYYFLHTTGNYKPVILPNYSDLLNSYFLNDNYISYNTVSRYDSSSLGSKNGYTQYFFNNLESNPKRKNPELESGYQLYSPRNIYQVIALPSGNLATKLNCNIDLDTVAFGYQYSFHSLGEGTWNLDTLTGMLSFTPYTDFSSFPTILRFNFYEVGNLTKFSASTNIIPYNYGQGPQIIRHNSENAFMRLGGIPRYDYAKNSLKEIKVFNNANILVNHKEYIYTSPFDFNRITSKIHGANVISTIPITKFSVGISIGIFFNGATVVKPEIGIAARDRIVRSAEVYPYTLDIERYDLLTEKETIYDLNGQNPVISEKTYKYSNWHHNPIETSLINSKSQVVKNIVKYSYDLLFDQATPIITPFNSLPDLDNKLLKENLNRFYVKNMIVPILEYSSNNGNVTSGKYTEFYYDQDSFSGVGLPKTEYVLELDTPLPEISFEPLKLKSFERTVNNPTNTGFEVQKFVMFEKSEAFVPRLFVDEYNTKGLPTKYRKSGDPVTHIGYSFSDLIPISKTLAFGTPLARTTYYDYIPLYGLKQVISPNLLIQRYEYDEIGRLKTLKNAQNEILKSYVYKILGF